MAKNSTTLHEWVLTPSEVVYFNRYKQESIHEGKPMVLWGWKRDRIENGVRYPESRTVYFSADLKEEGGRVTIERSFFFLETRAKTEEIEVLRNRIGDPTIIPIADQTHEGYSRLKLVVGVATDYDTASVRRRLLGKPRITISPPHLVNESFDYDISSFAPFALCVGSGLSSESGLPLLGSTHKLFEVDNFETGELVFGAQDTLQERIIADTDGEFAKFCQFTIDAIKANPSNSHAIIADLYNKKIIRQVFTDNMDTILEKVHVPFTKTRLSIFPDRYPISFDPTVKSLLVIGVAVDRRDVIKQARKRGLNIIAINPVFGVAPHSRNMDYLVQGDILFKQKAYEVLPKIINASLFENRVKREIMHPFLSV